MKISKLFSFLMLAFIFIHCGDSEELVDPKNPSGVLYFNSFENSDDLNEFDGYAGELSDDVMDNAGDSCMVVNGGCIVPHAYLDLGPFNDDKLLKMSVYAKYLGSFGGGITARNISDFTQSLELNVQDSVWTFYETDNNLELLAGDTLRINFISGGLVCAPSAFDLFTIEEVEN